MRRQLGNFLALLVSLCVALVFIEMSLRLYFYGNLDQPDYHTQLYEPHPTRGWAARPNLETRLQDLAFNVPLSMNSRGLRGPEHSLEPDPKRFRILIVSDSAMFGTGVRDDETTPAQLEALLGRDRFEVINLSLAAYSTVQEYVFFLEEGLKYRPDLVLLGFAPVNDIQTNYQPLQEKYQKSLGRPYASLQNGKLAIDYSTAGDRTERRAKKRALRSWLRNYVTDHSVTYRLLRAAVGKFRGGKPVDPNIFLGWAFLEDFAMDYAEPGMTRADYERLWAGGWAVTKALILDMRDKAQGIGAKFAMFIAPSKIEGDSEFRQSVQEAFPAARINIRKIYRELKSLGDAEGIPTFEVAAALDEAIRRGEQDVYFDFADEHWTARGHEIAAEALARQLTAGDLLTK
ncbi:MAG: SGNH/GDSL hydrolase family protein [Rhodospirillales bacterium]|nr:SGNH/GDSL hydrolase family protein [Rhodospirillales bacterium]MDH3910602.1 SGNH/GDSL hydrolase family protein [Rhodospirillales bacterium]MDH3917356.1 SGNH/GDSL hydrolase family protein [Rhodospirillales bacterium]MDH3965887.1 SGNH/GDSL hydrolase family protein [Rhodospirillales bacterium]